MYFMITNAEENYHGFQYHDGLNILDKYVSNELLSRDYFWDQIHYFSDAANILKYLDYGIYLREIELPDKDPDFKIINNSEGDKWRANKIILGKKYLLNDPLTFRFLIEKGVDIKVNNNYAICWASEHNSLEIVKILVENGADVQAYGNRSIRQASNYGFLEIVKFLVQNGADVQSFSNYAITYASLKGHVEIVKFLFENGANFRANNNLAIKWASMNGHLEVVKFLTKNGADIQVDHNYAVRHAFKNKHTHVVKFLIDNDADFYDIEP